MDYNSWSNMREQDRVYLMPNNKMFEVLRKMNGRELEQARKTAMSDIARWKTFTTADTNPIKQNIEDREKQLAEIERLLGNIKESESNKTKED